MERNSSIDEVLMMGILHNPEQFSQILYQKMQVINPAVADLELFEFRYALVNLLPKTGWESMVVAEPLIIEEMVNSRNFYELIQLRPKVNGKPVMDDQIIHLTQMLFTGLVIDKYSSDWISELFLL